MGNKIQRVKLTEQVLWTLAENCKETQNDYEETQKQPPKETQNTNKEMQHDEEIMLNDFNKRHKIATRRCNNTTKRHKKQ